MNGNLIRVSQCKYTSVSRAVIEKVLLEPANEPSRFVFGHDNNERGAETPPVGFLFINTSESTTKRKLQSKTPPSPGCERLRSTTPPNTPWVLSEACTLLHHRASCPLCQLPPQQRGERPCTRGYTCVPTCVPTTSEGFSTSAAVPRRPSTNSPLTMITSFLFTIWKTFPERKTTREIVQTEKNSIYI